MSSTTDPGKMASSRAPASDPPKFKSNGIECIFSPAISVKGQLQFLLGHMSTPQSTPYTQGYSVLWFSMWESPVYLWIQHRVSTTKTSQTTCGGKWFFKVKLGFQPGDGNTNKYPPRSAKEKSKITDHGFILLWQSIKLIDELDNTSLDCPRITHHQNK